MKSSLLALALFFLLFAFASKPSLASRQEPSLLRSDGNNYDVSAIREFVEDGIDLIMSKSDCPNKSSWPGLVGKNGKLVVAFIKIQNPCLNVYLCPASGIRCLTRDLRADRVRVWVDEEGIVDEVPKIG